MRPRVGKPLRIAIPCAGLAPGDSVTVKVFEPHGLGGDPIETLTAAVEPNGGVASVTWTYDHEAHKDKVSRALFVLLVEGAGRTSISRPIEFVQTFEATIKDDAGHPAANRLVILHAERGRDVTGATNAKGKIKVDVPPGNYHVELQGAAPPELERCPVEPEAPAPEETHTEEASAGKPEEPVLAATIEPASPDGEAAPRIHFLSARFFDRRGWNPARGLAFKVEGTSGQTDGDGKALVPALPRKLLDVTFDRGAVTVLAVHDPDLVLRVRLPFLEPTGDAPPDRTETPPRPETIARPASLFPGGEPPEVTDPGEDTGPEDGWDVHARGQGGADALARASDPPEAPSP